ncbi:GFA family protein [Thalassotalea euphylliae]|uniref:GFA family protein n=1 Tax=Thalassotalea euphylliae TaxID=1655234 RepID=UPI00362F01D0
MNAKTRGSCNCGTVTFQIHTVLNDVYICHCSICRKSTGSGGIAVCVVPNTQFEWLTGQNDIKTWYKPGHDWETTFCTYCGSPLPGKNDDNSTYIPASLLDTNTEALAVKKHIFTCSKAPWEVIPDNDGAE